MIRRWSKSTHILVGIALTGMLLLTATQTWWTMSIAQGTNITVQGSTAVSALVAIGVALLALCAALSLCGRLSARTLSILETLFALAGGALMLIAAHDPIAASRPVLATATGVSGVETLRTLVESTRTSAWLVVTFVVLVLIAAHGVQGWIVSARWTAPSGYKRRRRVVVVDLEDSASVWDALSDGDDPTRNP